MEGGVMDGGGEEEQQRKTALRMLRRSPAKEVCNWSATPAHHHCLHQYS